MTIIDADKFLTYLIFSKHIDGLNCGEVKKAIKMCKVDVLDKIRAEIEEKCCITVGRECDGAITLYDVFEIIDKYKAENEEGEAE